MSRVAIVLTALLAPSLAIAQRAAPAQDKEAVVFDEVERGLFFGVEAGVSGLLNPPATEGRARPFSLGQIALVEVGYEIGDRLAIALFVMGATNRASSEYTGFSENQRASGDFTSLVPGATARLSLLGFSDSQGVQRAFLYLRGGAGYAMFWPKTLLPDSDVFVFAGPGLEYFTRLRHFSIGLEVTGSYLVKGAAMGFTVTPNLRYAF